MCPLHRAERNARYQKEKLQKQELQEGARKAKLMEQQQAAMEAEARRRYMPVDFFFFLIL